MREHEYCVYIMSSNSGTLYIGMTNSIYRRALQHKRGEIKGFSSKYQCTRLVYYQSFDDGHHAIGREKQLRGWTRAKKITLLESQNPWWADLAEHWGARMRFAGESVKKSNPSTCYPSLPGRDATLQFCHPERSEEPATARSHVTSKGISTIYDFVQASQHFIDPEWDGEPLPDTCGRCGVYPCECERTASSTRAQSLTPLPTWGFRKKSIASSSAFRNIYISPVPRLEPARRSGVFHDENVVSCDICPVLHSSEIRSCHQRKGGAAFRQRAKLFRSNNLHLSIFRSIFCGQRPAADSPKFFEPRFCV